MLALRCCGILVGGGGGGGRAAAAFEPRHHPHLVPPELPLFLNMIEGLPQR